MPLIRVRNLHHTYSLRAGEQVHALRDVDFSIEPGEYVAIVGSNGSGKTTLALHLNGILLPTDGEVIVDGRATTDPETLRHVRSTVGMVFQSPDDQIVATVVEEDVAFGPENLGVDERELPGLVQSVLERVGMWEHRKRQTHQLSAGQKQRVAVAAALAMRPRCLVLDEATSMLDPEGTRDIMNIVDGLRRDGITIIVVTHKMEEAARADRMLVLHSGRLVMDGRPVDVFRHPDLATWRLHPPAILTFADRIRSRIAGMAELPEELFDAEALASALSEIKAS